MFRAAVLVVGLLAGAGLSGAGLSSAATPSAAAASAAATDVTAFLPADHRGEDPTTIPAEVPGQTPAMRDGSVRTIVQVGNRVILGGTFAGATDPDGGTDYAQPYLVSYDIATGRVDPAFRPVLTGTVNSVVAAADGSSVYVGGFFREGAQGGKNLVRLDVATGARVAGFATATLDGGVNDLQLSGSRLFVAGTFTRADGVAHGGLAVVDATTGVVDHSFATLVVATNHNWPANSNSKAPVGVTSIAVSPNGTRMTAIGNFRTVNGMDRDQVFTALIGATSVTVDPAWRTDRYTPACGRAYDSYVREVDYSPDGTYWVVASTGSGRAGTLCDAAARFEADGTGTTVQPTWVAATGCDTLLSVEITTAAVYVGGHSKWMNAPNTGCSAKAQQAQVPRPGIAALEPLSGIPMRWNPGRHPRGAGAWVVYANAAGVFVGSDTDYIGARRYNRPKVAFFPLAGGTPAITQPDPVLPSRLLQLGGPSGSSAITARSFAGTSAGSPVSTTIPDAVSFSGTVGGFMVGEKFVYGRTSTRALYFRTFDGTRFGPEVLIDPYNDPYWSNISVEGGTLTFRGLLPEFYAQLASVTSMTYTRGRIYYTLSGQSALYWRWFSPDSLIVGANQFTVSGAPDMRYAKGMYYADQALWRGSTTSSSLFRLSFAGLVPSGSFVAQTGPGFTGTTFGAAALFLGPQPNTAPVARGAVTCAEQACTLDGSASSDPDGSIVSSAWTVDGVAAGSTSVVSATVPTPGAHSAVLTVTDDRGSTSSTTVSFTVRLSPTAVIGASCAARSCTLTGTGSTDPENAALAYTWTFGDGFTSTSPNPDHLYAAAGTYQVGLTVTDPDGLTSTASRSLQVSSTQVAFRSEVSINGSGRSLNVTVPADVQPGDLLLVALTTGTGAVPVASGVPGLTVTGTATVPNSATTTVWQKVAESGDAGATLTMTLSDSAFVKAGLTVMAYSGTSTTAPVRSFAGAYDTSARTAHLTPEAAVFDNDLVVSLWADRSGDTALWTAPEGLVTRDMSVGTGPGHVSLLVADSGLPLVQGTSPARTGTTDSSTRATSITVVLAGQ